MISSYNIVVVCIPAIFCIVGQMESINVHHLFRILIQKSNQYQLKTKTFHLFHLQCHFWDISSSSWIPDICTPQVNTLVIESQPYAVCECTEVGVVRVTAGELRPIPTTTIIAPTTATAAITETSKE